MKKDLLNSFRKEATMNKRSAVERILRILPLTSSDWVQEFKFHPKRKWRFDFACPVYKIAVEFEGGVFTEGGHVHGAMYSKNCDKYNAATILGWHILRYTAKHLSAKNGEFMIVSDVQDLLKTL